MRGFLEAVDRRVRIDPAVAALRVTNCLTGQESAVAFEADGTAQFIIADAPGFLFLRYTAACN
jgi:hypothetical protein